MKGRLERVVVLGFGPDCIVIMSAVVSPAPPTTGAAAGPLTVNRLL
jgi:hypothetical protein